MGRDVFALQTGVIGPRGFVPLEEQVLLCCEECVKDYVDPVDLSVLPRRIP